MRRTLAAIAATTLALGACGADSSKPQASPKAALDKAQELVRREAALGIPHARAEDLANGYGTHGDGFCAPDPDNHQTYNLLGDFSRRRQHELLQEANLIVEIYCPWMPRFGRVSSG